MIDAVTCSECSEALREGDRFCIHCGAGIDAAPAAREPESRAGACAACGTPLKPADRFCQTCGASVEVKPPEPHASRLSAPIDARYLAVEDPPTDRERPAATAIPTSKPEASNRTFYQLLGLALILIACGYLAYDYMMTSGHGGPRDAAQTVAEGFGQEIDLLTPVRSGDTVPPASPPSAPFATLPQPPAETRLADDGGPLTASNSPPPNNAEPAPQPNQEATQLQPEPNRNIAPIAPKSGGSAVSAGPSSTTSPPVSQPETTAADPASAIPSRRPDPPGRLLPGSQTWKSAPNTDVSPSRHPQPAPPKPVAPTPPATEGILYWTGKLEKNKVVVIERGEASIGQASGDLFTGIPIDVHLPSPAVVLVERPTPRNRWRRVAFRCLRNTKGSVTINVQWNLLR